MKVIALVFGIDDYVNTQYFRMLNSAVKGHVLDCLPGWINVNIKLVVE